MPCKTQSSDGNNQLHLAPAGTSFLTLIGFFKKCEKFAGHQKSELHFSAGISRFSVEHKAFWNPEHGINAVLFNQK